MLGHGTPRTVRHVGLGFLLVLAAASDTEPLEGARAPELSGACYCRATAELRCVPDLTERDCARRCTEELCDDWFWLERTVDRKSTRLNSSHLVISYAVFCLK